MDSIDQAYPGSESTTETPQIIKLESGKRRSKIKAIKEKFSIRCLAFSTLMLLFSILFLCLIGSFVMIFFGSSNSGEEKKDLSLLASSDSSFKFPGAEERPVY